MAGYPKILHTEEGMRDGLQIESPDISVEDKTRLIDALSETGLREIAYEGAPSPWKAPITSYQRADSLIQGNAPANNEQAPDSAPSAKVFAIPR